MRLKNLIHSSNKKKVNSIYLDYAASTPVAPDVLETMLPYFKERFGNPGSIHSFGQSAQSALDKSREAITNALGTKFSELIFTSSATEANNLAIRGVLASANIKNPQIIISSIEHESILDTVKALEKEGVEVVYLPVSSEGLVNPDDVIKNIKDNTILVSIIYASNEIGTIQPIKEISNLIRNFRGSKTYPLFHTDAVQALQFLDCRVEELGIDLMTMSSQKIYGPKGAGALFVKGLEPKGSNKLKSIITGGGQEYNLRSGTENVPAIVGFAKALELIEKNKSIEAKRIKQLRNHLWERLKIMKPELELNGPDVDSSSRLENNLNIYFPGHEAQDLVIKLDMAGVSVSTGSACSSRSTKASYVVKALDLGEDRAKSSLRISLGRPSTLSEVDKAYEEILNLL